MARSRPPTLLTLARRAIHDERLFGRGDRVLVACSGGPDSTALLHALSLLRRRIGHELAAVGVDHGLRPEATGELKLAASLAAEHGVAFEVIRVAVEPGANLQARARRARHGALQREAARLCAAVIALGHSADDRAETVLMRLLRGSGPRGLAAMPPRSASAEGDVELVRPLLRCRRADVVAHLERHRLAWAEDPSNRDRRFMRVRVRHELMPLLESLSPRIVEHLCHLADVLAPGEDPFAGLGRAQRQAIQRAVRLGRKRTTVRVSGGRDMQLTFLDPPPVRDPEQ